MTAPAVEDDIEFYVRWRGGPPVGPFTDVGQVRAHMARYRLGSPDDVIVPHHRR